MDLPQLHADLLSESARLRPLLVPPPLCVVLDAEAARAKQPAGPTSAHASQPPSPGQQPLHHDHEDISSSSHSSDGEDDGGDPFARIMALTTTAASATEQSEQPRKRRSARRREKDQQYWERRTRMRQAREAQQQPPTRPLCRNFLNGLCMRGESCPYSHDAQPLRPAPVCKYFIAGKCRKGEQCEFSHRHPCRFFHLYGRCSAGDTCRFSHDELQPGEMEVLKQEEAGAFRPAAAAAATGTDAGTALTEVSQPMVAPTSADHPAAAAFVSPLSLILPDAEA